MSLILLKQIFSRLRLQLTPLHLQRSDVNDPPSLPSAPMCHGRVNIATHPLSDGFRAVPSMRLVAQPGARCRCWHHIPVSYELRHQNPSHTVIHGVLEIG
uniref:Uncharacterized protein n=1 Tax=Haptolina brevifila TaxID=156173 RepID=A0A7S2BXI2_9EUKA|mmetsp:Transcript_18025/g.36323  ORF Transcript_18025/g.36323 Transcript_18025/m.36323 type:complete len:100 (+) Transcript_18025:172-471(+)